MNSNENKKKNREKRGQISPNDTVPYADFSTEDLIGMLNAENPQERTISAVLLGNRNDKLVINPLCTALKNERSLYSRIAISEALSQIGEPAAPCLIQFLGEIGKNQEKELPLKYFKKKSFPLVRDMAARTLVKIGEPATPYLIEVLETGNEFKVQQAIDALGAISAKTGDKRALKSLITLMGQVENVSAVESDMDQVTLWKITRALSGFQNSKEVTYPLIAILKSDYEPPIIWEALRSLGQIQITTPEVLSLVESFIDNKQPEIRIAALNAFNLLNKQV
ncbi:HEAT repeat domain-containing protein [uncultured Methanobacterium sp.]|uniref:HEAT repeat domain-containing protein n=1 Tax=uncultured Methanobacterium sp. TaxID=176306 RepID=UPI002AA8DD1D|nr:HEAT repeat domain-containing protein [uncultured Methanobacterium sp.]